MSQPADTKSARPIEAPLDADSVWPLLLAAATAAEELSQGGQRAAFARDARNQLTPVRADDPDALLIWCAAGGWEPSPTIDADADTRTLIDLYLPICSATRSRPIAV